MLIAIGILLCVCNTDDVTVSAVRVMSVEAYENMSANMSAVAVNAIGTSLAGAGKHVLAACKEFYCEAAASQGMIEVLKKEFGSGGGLNQCEEKYAGFASPDGDDFVVKKCLRSHITAMKRTCSCSVDHVCQDFFCETSGSHGLIDVTWSEFGSGGGMNQCEEKYEGFATNGFEIVTNHCLRPHNSKQKCSCVKGHSKHACPSTTTQCEASARDMWSIKFKTEYDDLQAQVVKFSETQRKRSDIQFIGKDPEPSWFKKIGESRVQGKGHQGVCIEIYQGSAVIKKTGQQTFGSQGVECHRPLSLDKCAMRHCDWQ